MGDGVMGFGGMEVGGMESSGLLLFSAVKVTSPVPAIAVGL